MRTRMILAVVTLAMALFTTARAQSWLYVLEGTFRQETTYTYQVILQPSAKATTATLPLLREIDEPWYAVRIKEQAVTASLAPSNQKTSDDTWGNRWTILSWPQLSAETIVKRQSRVVSEALYGPIRTSDPYPLTRTALTRVPGEALKGTNDIQKDDPSIRALASAAVAGCLTELEAVAEPPRLFRRVDHLSPATVTGPFSLW